jgi:DNA-binding Lrp family transcriptional regulator
MVVARLPDSEDVARLISDFEAIPEVDRTNSTFVVEEQKDVTRPLQSYDLETLLSELVED